MEISDVFTTWKKIAPGTKEGLLVFGALLLVVTVLFIWAVFIRKRGERRKKYHYPSKTSGEGVIEVHRKKWRKRRKEHRPRNPTLSETGGLPPIRSETDQGSAP
jgi:hypothetical protein